MMKQFLYNSKPLLKSVKIFLMVILPTFLLSSCDNEDLDIQQNFPFEVSVMPVPKTIANKQTVEIRIAVVPTGNFNNTQYFIRYFQYDGLGTLHYYQDAPYLPNDLYPLAMKQFRLYYTSQSTVSQSFEVWISDNFGNEKQLSFQFSNTD